MVISIEIIRQKLNAFLVHLLLSGILAGILLGAVFFLWYPGLYHFFGAGNGLVIFLCIDLVLGPLLTFIIYLPGKPGLYKDIAIILSLQLAVFMFGVWTIYLQRPYLQVLSHQQLEVYTYNDVKSYRLSLPVGANSSRFAPNSYFMYLPENIEQIEAIKFTSEFVDLKPFAFRTDLYRSFSEGNKWGLEKLLSRFPYNSAQLCYWVDVSSTHFIGKACIVGQTGEIILLK